MQMFVRMSHSEFFLKVGNYAMMAAAPDFSSKL